MVQNPVSARIADLWKVQELDSALDSRRATLTDAEARLGESDELVALRARVEELRAAVQRARAAQKDVDLDADGLRAKIAPAETKLYSGSIKNPKELSDLQADIDQMKRHLAAVEDRDLEAMSALESAEHELTSASSELSALEGAWQAEQRELEERVAALRAEIAGYEESRAEAVADMEADLMRRYEHLRRAHQGRGVAKLDRNVCLGCRISLPTNVVNRARAGNVLVQCPNCERILYA